MDPTTFKKPTDTEQAAEAGMSRTAWSLRKNGKRGLSPGAEARYQQVIAKYLRIEQIAALEQREIENLAAVGQRVLEASL